MGLFDKKYCSICGKEIGMMGNLLGIRKQEDGNICKECSAKLSPWFSGKKHTSVEDIKKQLAYRESNKLNLSRFNPTLVVEGTTKVFIDEAAKTFIVTRSNDWSNSNPDIISIAQVQDVTYEVDEDSTEIYQTIDGKKVSYDPKQYEYEYEFYVTLKVNSPWFDSIRFEVEDGPAPESKEGEAYFNLEYKCRSLQHLLCPGLYCDPALTMAYEAPAPEQPVEEPAADESWTCECGTVNTTKFCGNCDKPKPVVQRWFCPECGKENIGKFCVHCGTPRPDYI